MREPFQIEWLGGVAEHFFRKARPGTDDLPWGTLDTSKYPPELVLAARRTWTELALNEYRAIVAFSDVVRALAAARAPLDLIGMTSDFLADEARHVELASRVAMELGGAVPFPVETDALFPEADPTLTPLQRASDVVLRVGCISESFAGGTAIHTLRAATHPLIRAVYTSILADEARHRRFGWIYMDWVEETLDDAERARLSVTLRDTLEAYSGLWKAPPSPVHEGRTVQGWSVDDIHALGTLESARFVEVARDVVGTEILDPLARFGIVVSAEAREQLLGRPDST